MDMLRYERRQWRAGRPRVAGVDEAGRGPLAGPVVAAAVILPAGFHHDTLTDSKQLTARQREQIFEELTQLPGLVWAVGVANVEQIDSWNILRATEHAMREALRRLQPAPEHVLVDGRPLRDCPFPQTAIVGGDAKSFSIAAASVLAKVTRDRMMTTLHAQYPQYNFARHKGYGTAEHLAALRRFGPSPVHRRSFAPVRHALEMVASPCAPAHRAD
ncbi:MAG: ribonuclease HII [Verrucomicrobiae bacterium]|nr:ribonuclease HII [Verrucomicrobiae bacterium]